MAFRNEFDLWIKTRNGEDMFYTTYEAFDAVADEIMPKVEGMAIHGDIKRAMNYDFSKIDALIFPHLTELSYDVSSWIKLKYPNVSVIIDGRVI